MTRSSLINLPVFRLIVVLVVLVFLAVAGVTIWWNTGDTVDDLRERAGLVGKSELRIGVHVDQPSISYRDDNGEFSGFDVEIGKMVAADLGFRPEDVRFLEVENEDRNRMESADHNDLDLVIATYSITKERVEQGATFSAPYLETSQTVMTRRDHAPVPDLSRLQGTTACTLTTSTSRTPIAEAGAKVEHEDRISNCVGKLGRDNVESVTTDAAILAGFVAQKPREFELHDVGLETRELWGINTGGNEALRTLVNLSLYKSRNDPNDQRWENAYTKWLAPLQAVIDRQHDEDGEQGQTGQQPVALRRQPLVEPVEVRQWPWERAT